MQRKPLIRGRAGLGGDSKVKGSPPAFLRLNPDSPAMALDDFFAD